MAHLREIANDNERIGDEEHTLARFGIYCTRKRKNGIYFSLVWLGSCARAIPIVSKNLKVSLELVANIPDSAHNTASDRQISNICLFFCIYNLYFMLGECELRHKQNEH